MSYSAIANSEIDASSPLTETLLTKFRDNVEGHNHSEATTADVVNAGLQAYTAGDYMVQSNDTERLTALASYVKLKEIKSLIKKEKGKKKQKRGFQTALIISTELSGKNKSRFEGPDPDEKRRSGP